MDEETWPELKPQYPFNVVAINEPRVFNLSQLEGLYSTADSESQEPLEAALDRNEFLFEFESNNQRNQRILDALAAQEKPNNAGVIENHQEIPNRNQNNDALDSNEVLDSIEETNQSAPQQLDSQKGGPSFSAGTLAYMRTTENSSLKGISKNLNWSSRFKLLSHNSWVQPISAEPIFILVQTGQRYDNRYEVEGTLSFSRNRYLHVQTDLWYTRFESRKNINDDARKVKMTTQLSDDILSQYKDLVAVEDLRGQYFVAATHPMTQSRRIRSTELHYIDHPMFGVIIRINRYDPAIQAKKQL